MPSKEELKSILQKQKKEIKTLKKKVKRKEEKICSLTGLIKDLNEKTLIDQKTVIKLNEHFSGLTLDTIKNQINNQDRDPRGRQYSDEVKKFALTLP